MRSRMIMGRTVSLVLFMVWGAWGCAGHSFDPPQTDEIPKGPGVFTKDKGSVVLYDSNQRKAPSTAADEKSKVLPASGDHSSTPQDYEAFEAYQQWLQWKKSAVENGEYEAFEQWRAWKKYKDWKNSK